MAASVAATMDLTEDEKRWAVVGIALNKVVIASTRPSLKDGIEKEYENLKTHHIDTQIFGRQCLAFRSGGPAFQYKNINGNQAVRDKRYWDYKVISAIDLGRLCLASHMAHFTAFDDSCDGSAVLTLLGCVPRFHPSVQGAAKDVRSKVRNEWAHCNFGEWDERLFHSCFRDMEKLLNVMALNDAEVELKEWEDKGVEMIMRAPDEVATLLSELVESSSVVVQAIKEIQEKLKQMVENQAVMNETLGTLATKEQVEKIQQTVGEVAEDVKQLKICNMANSSDAENQYGDVVERFKAHLIQHYTVGEETVIDPLPWMDEEQCTLEEMFTELLIVSTDSNQQVHQVAMHNIFWADKSDVKITNVLIEGDPGVGKSTFCRKLAYDWAMGRIDKSSHFPEFEMLLNLNCLGIEHDSVPAAIHTQLIPEEFTEEERGILWNYIKLNQEKVCIIFDGCDEIPETQTGFIMGLGKVIAKKSLSQCSVIVTARQNKSRKLHKKGQRLLEIKGFVESGPVEYIQKFYNSEMLMTELVDFIISNPFIVELITNPLNIALLCIIFRENKERLLLRKEFDIRDLYDEIVFCITKRYCLKKNIDVDDETLMHEFQERHQALGHLAFEGLQNGQLNFGAKEIPGELTNVGFLVKRFSKRSVRSTESFYFAHKSFQDFFAALYLADILKKGECAGIVLTVTSDSLNAMGRYDLPGLIGSASAGSAARSITSALDQKSMSPYLLALLCELLSQCKNEDDFQETLESIYLQTPVTADIFFQANSKKKALEGLSILLKKKAQHAADSNNAVENATDLFPLQELILYDLQKDDFATYLCHAMVENTCVQHLDVRESNVGDRDVMLLADILRQKGTLSALSVDLGTCSKKSTLELINSLMGNDRLKRLDIQRNNADSSSASALKKLLEKNVLTHLRISSTNIDARDVISIATGLANNTSLELIFFQSFQRFSAIAVSQLCKALERHMTLRVLRIVNCGIGDSSAKKIAKTIPKMNGLCEISVRNYDILDPYRCGLQEKDLKEAIGDKGAVFLAQALNKSKKLTACDLSFNRILSEGATTIGQMLSNNSVLTELNISLNHIGDCGAIAIASGLRENTTLKKLNVSHNDINWIGICSLAQALTRNKTLLEFNISGNVSTVRDNENKRAKALLDMLSQNDVLQSLFVSDIGIGNLEATSIAEGLANNSALKVLSINGNAIGEKGMCALAHGVARSSLEVLEVVGINIDGKSAKLLTTACKSSTTLREITHSSYSIRNKCGTQERFVGTPADLLSCILKCI